MQSSYTFGVRLAFLLEKRNKTYTTYGDVSIAQEKVDIAQKTFQQTRLCWVTGKVGV